MASRTSTSTFATRPKPMQTLLVFLMPWLLVLVFSVWARRQRWREDAPQDNDCYSTVDRDLYD